MSDRVRATSDPAEFGLALVPVQRRPQDMPFDGEVTSEEITDPDQTSGPTRRLCALVHVNRELLDEVEGHFIGRRNHAWVPCYSVDLVALLQHARSARRRQVARDLLLTLIIGGGLALIGYAVLDGRPLGLLLLVAAAATVAVLRILVATGRTSLRAVAVRLTGHTKGQWRRTVMRGTWAAGAAVLLAGLVVSTRQGRLSIAVLALTSVIAWLIIVSSAAIAALAANRTANSVKAPRRLGPPLTAALADRATAVSHANVLVYARSRARAGLGPFVGAGQRLSQWTTPPVDVELGVPANGDGHRTTPKRVNIVDLHRRLESEVRNHRILNLDVEHRLYVDGAVLAGSAGLIASAQPGEPLPFLAPDLIMRYAERGDPYRRVYLCLQVTDWRGDVVVTMFVRAILEQELLQLEVAIHALPEVAWRVGAGRATGATGPNSRPEPDKLRSHDVPSRPFYAALAGTRFGTRTYWPTLLGAPWRLAIAAAAPVRRGTNSRRYRSTTRQGGAHDYGADISLREELALGQDLHYNALIDTLGHAARLQHRLLRAFANYLRECDIDLQEVVAKSETIINNINQTIINDLRAGVVTIGSNNQASGTYSENKNPGGTAPTSGQW